MSDTPLTLPYAATREREPAWRPIACFLILLAGLQVCFGNRIELSQWNVSGEWNAGVAEGAAWLQRRLDIPHTGADPAHHRLHDTAFFNGKVYNVFPPLMGFLTFLLGPLHQALLGRSDFWLPWPYTLLCFWPVPLTGYIVFRRLSGDSAWGALLTASWIGGTAVLPNLFFANRGYLGPTHHLLSQVGLLIFAADLLGRQRIWPALLGLTIAAWSRQMTALYALPLLWVAHRRGRLPLAIVGLTLIATPLLTLNTLKFGCPWNFGYQYMYVGREHEEVAQNCLRYGTFSPHFLAINAWYMHVEPPRFDLSTVGLVHAGNWFGTAIWWTTPLLLLVPACARRWWRDPGRRLLILGTLPVMFGLLCYHDPGFQQFGYNRFSLDYLPIWLAVIAPYTRQAGRAWFTLAASAWSALYFSLLRF